MLFDQFEPLTLCLLGIEEEGHVAVLFKVQCRNALVSDRSVTERADLRHVQPCVEQVTVRHF